MNNFEPCITFQDLPLLSKYSDVMLLAEKSFTNHQLVNWLKTTQWHYIEMPESLAALN